MGVSKGPHPLGPWAEGTPTCLPRPWTDTQREISQYINSLTKCSLIRSAARKVKGFQEEI